MPQAQADFEVTVQLETGKSVSVSVDSLTTVSSAATLVCQQFGIKQTTAFSIVTPCREKTERDGVRARHGSDTRAPLGLVVWVRG